MIVYCIFNYSLCSSFSVRGRGSKRCGRCRDVLGGRCPARTAVRPSAAGADGSHAVGGGGRGCKRDETIPGRAREHPESRPRDAERAPVGPAVCGRVGRPGGKLAGETKSFLLGSTPFHHVNSLCKSWPPRWPCSPGKSLILQASFSAGLIIIRNLRVILKICLI